MTDLLALADRVEALAGPCRETDLKICVCVLGRSIGVSRYTASLDAALTLVPEGWAVEPLTFWPVPDEYRDDDNMLPPACVRLVGCSPKRWGRKTIYGHGGNDGRASAKAATPALSLCAAALRALATTEGPTK